MGNCQAVDATTLVIQFPNGNVERMYFPVKASEVMKLYPSHYVSLIIPLPMSGHEASLTPDRKKTVRYNRVKLLRPRDTLVLGHAYRLLTSQEVKKVLRANNLTKGNMSDRLQMSPGNKQNDEEKAMPDKNDEGSKNERGIRSGSNSRPKTTWRPSLKSISEAVS